uniref:BTB domain-containing protein n=1 Tax=Panagrolaimus davidi TaxID=227884 RepID=A0A914QZ90_9BILA
MIHSSFKESNESKVLIPDFDLEVIEIAIKFCYGISITNDELNVLNGIKLLQFSDKYDICDLKDSIEIYLFNQKSLMNICEIVNASIISNSIKLREQCFDFILDCMKKRIFHTDARVDPRKLISAADFALIIGDSDQLNHGIKHMELNTRLTT